VTNAARQAAANAAIALVEDGMRLGLGTGRAMALVVAGLAGRRITGVATSAATAAQATALGITLEDPDLPVDLALDGADQVERRTLRLLKGGGGALTREKIIAETARRFVVVAEEPKLVDHLGTGFPLPIEILPFGAAATARRIAALGGAPRPRQGTTDNGNLILDCPGFAPIRDPFTLERQLRAIAGVVATGLFLMPVERAFLGRADGTVLELRP
jgi:ribose 5-phosphate isomerase A